jgi:hypothetical protein
LQAQRAQVTWTMESQQSYPVDALALNVGFPHTQLQFPPVV